MQELREVYKAPTEEMALGNLKLLEENRADKYRLAVISWQNNRNNLSTFFKYPEEIRTIIYTTNSVEALHRQFRKVTKNRALSPNNDALKKMLFLAYRDLSEKWTMPWAVVLSDFSIYFEDRFNKFL